jgi:hypothetical protein
MNPQQGVKSSTGIKSGGPYWLNRYHLAARCQAVEVVRPGLNHRTPLNQVFGPIIRASNLIPFTVGELALDCVGGPTHLVQKGRCQRAESVTGHSAAFITHSPERCITAQGAYVAYAVTDLLRRTGGKADHGQFRAGLPSFDFSQRITIDKGCVQVEDDPVWQDFKAALNGVDIDRLRRCPEPKCGQIYYATRDNKMACDKHLAVAAVKRSQEKKKVKAADYELNRKATRLAKRKGIGIGEALKLVRAEVRMLRKCSKPRLRR